MQAPAPICTPNDGDTCGGETGYLPLQVSGDGLAAQGRVSKLAGSAMSFVASRPWLNCAPLAAIESPEITPGQCSRRATTERAVTARQQTRKADKASRCQRRTLWCLSCKRVFI